MHRRMQALMKGFAKGVSLSLSFCFRVKSESVKCQGTYILKFDLKRKYVFLFLVKELNINFEI